MSLLKELKDAYYKSFVLEKDLSNNKISAQAHSAESFYVSFTDQSYNEANEFPKNAIMKQYLDSDSSDRISREADILELVGNLHSNIVKVYHHMEIESKMTIFMEFFHEHSLAWKIFHKEITISRSTLLKNFAIITDILVFLHSKNIAHRDLKPDNIFVLDIENWKLGEFGGAKKIRINNQNTTEGSKNYISPFVSAITEEGINKSNKIDPMKEDVYSLGKTFYEIATLNINCQFHENESRNKDIIKNEMKNYSYSQEFINIILEMVDYYKADNRPTMREVYRKIIELEEFNFSNYSGSQDMMIEEAKNCVHEGGNISVDWPSSERSLSRRIGNSENLEQYLLEYGIDINDWGSFNGGTNYIETDYLSDTNMESTEPSNNMNTIARNPNISFDDILPYDNAISVSSFESTGLPCNDYLTETLTNRDIACECGMIETFDESFENYVNECKEIGQSVSCRHCGRLF